MAIHISQGLYAFSLLDSFPSSLCEAPFCQKCAGGRRALYRSQFIRQRKGTVCRRQTCITRRVVLRIALSKTQNTFPRWSEPCCRETPGAASWRWVPMQIDHFACDPKVFCNRANPGETVSGALSTETSPSEASVRSLYPGLAARRAITLCFLSTQISRRRFIPCVR